MKPIATIFAAMSIAGLASGTAMANCHDKVPSMNDQTASVAAGNQGIAKDGTRAPLETEDKDKVITWRIPAESATLLGRDAE